MRKRGLSNGSSLGYHAGWCDEVADLLENALALIRELAEENAARKGLNTMLDNELRRLGEELDTFREYAEKMQLLVESIMHKEEVGYEPSAARYAAEMDMWRVVALEKKKLTEEKEHWKKQYEESELEYVKAEKRGYAFGKADTVREMQERLHIAFRSDDGSIRNPDCYIRYVIDQIARKLLEETK